MQIVHTKVKADDIRSVANDAIVALLRCAMAAIYAVAWCLPVLSAIRPVGASGFVVERLPRLAVRTTEA